MLQNQVSDLLVCCTPASNNGSHGSFHSRENAGSYGTEWEVSKKIFDAIAWLGIVV